MFLCPLEGTEIRPVQTLGGERTNMVYYSGHRIADRYRLGPVDQGWRVIATALDAEHKIGPGDQGLESRGGSYGYAAGVALDAAVEWAQTPGPDGEAPISDPLVRARLAEAALEVELATITPGPMGRIVSSESCIRVADDLIDVVGPAGLLAHGEPGAIGDGWLEYAHRYAQGTAIYGGSTEIHRNIVAERILGLPRSTPSSRRVDAD
jgi:alkylation response protein AidB-like acyl-CoA dehydrogenase